MNNKLRYKRLLIISHNCLSETGSNGRTLGNYLKGWPREKIAQFYIHAEQPDFNICRNFFCLTDSEVGKSIVKRKVAGKVVEEREKQDVTSKTEFIHKNNKNSILFLLRDIVWKSRLWNKKKLEEWLEEYNPEVILVQAGDAGFLFKLAEQIGRKYKASIVVYNTEGYYFKKVSYLQDDKFTKKFYPILNKRFRKDYDSLIKNSKAEIYNCALLCEDYRKVYKKENYMIMNASQFTQEPLREDKKNTIIYAGNLGLMRHKSLIEFAEALNKVNPDMIIEVYGKAKEQYVADELKRCKFIKMQGFLPYDKLKEKLSESKYLLHVESFDDFYKEDLKYAFSTKIADSLAVGACLFVYAPKNMAVSQYLKGTNAAVLITDKKDLERKIRECIDDERKSSELAHEGRKLAEKNHDIEKNRIQFQQVILKQF